MEIKEKLIKEIIALNDDMSATALYWFSLNLQQLDLSELIKLKKSYKNGKVWK
jgi:hypothetical protein